jgi:hypothetical protein
LGSYKKSLNPFIGYLSVGLNNFRRSKTSTAFLVATSKVPEKDYILIGGSLLIKESEFFPVLKSNIPT